ncbi:hypothetical protein FNU76_23060 [Chitinimonas arctica]|uniref:Uncharacterized protein n=1 Tax=Chitinimonas arctica TaxID=2594795 RepID=A0A516SLI5_9NEIS|nr:hypothetical protein [Chitinimonas arctica]QDQ28993.1 hypothetical protein FNU76_23060 [Chitinimonas arctica]
MDAAPRLDRLYRLLPAIYRMRDAEQGYPLQALLRVMAEQVNVVEDDIGQLYENFFIETAADWAVPYVADLIGYRPVHATGAAGDTGSEQGRALNRVLVPRREVANVLRYRRRKGTLPLLEQLAGDIAGWPARAVEFYRLLAWNQHLNHLHLDRARTVDVRRMAALARLDGAGRASPFDRLAHTVEVRRVDSRYRQGRYNIPSVGVFLWRLKSYPVSLAPACCLEKPGPQCYSFSFLGQDAPLFSRPESSAGAISQRLRVPAAIGRLEFSRHPERFYGIGKSLLIWAEGWAGSDGKAPLPLDVIVVADLSGWRYTVPRGKVAIDPVLGRFAFPQRQLPKRGVRVSYHYGFSADMGGGEYRRTLFEPSARERVRHYTVRGSAGSDPADDTFQTIAAALAQWEKDSPADAVIELADSNVYVEPLAMHIASRQTLQLRAANRMRPAVRLLDYQTNRPDPLVVSLEPGACFTLDGVLVVGRPLRIEAGQADDAAETPAGTDCLAKVVIRHCTLVPGWGIGCDCEPMRPEEPSLELFNVQAALHIEHSILGTIHINEDEVGTDPIPVHISDSIVDATGSQLEALGAPGSVVAHALLTIRNSTVLGIVDVHAVVLAENTLFTGCLNVARRQLGCMRFCYVPPRCRTPRRYHCQPDLAVQAAKETVSDPLQQAALIVLEQERVRPRFDTERYGRPDYARLSEQCAAEIRRGAEDEAEIGAFHDLFQPQREANLRARLDEYIPVGCEVGMLFVN